MKSISHRQTPIHKMCKLSHVWLLATPWTAAYQAPPSMGFCGREGKAWCWRPCDMNCYYKTPVLGKWWLVVFSVKPSCFWNNHHVSEIFIHSLVNPNYSVTWATIRTTCESEKWVRCQLPCSRKIHRLSHFRGSWSQRWSWDSGSLGTYGNLWKRLLLLSFSH